MAFKVYAFTCGWLTLPMGLLLQGEKGKLKVPVPSYLIEHPKGRVSSIPGFTSKRRPSRIGGWDVWLRFTRLDSNPARSLPGGFARSGANRKRSI